MSDVQRSTDLQETYGSRAIGAGIGGLILGGLATWMFMYGGGMMIGLAWVLALAAAAGIVFAIMQISKARGVSSESIVCPYCQGKNSFSEMPSHDVRCNKCNRQIPIEDGRILSVTQVRCGFCNELNWYSERSIGLICENCNREIPISQADGSMGHTAMSAYTVKDDNAVYDLVLVGTDRVDDGLISAMQSMLALNRNQVKQILEATPVTLLTGIPKKKAELLADQLKMHHAQAEARVTQQ